MARWYSKRNALVARRLERAELRILATREVIESEWAKQMYEFYGNYRRALEVEDGPAAAVWARLYQDAWKAMMMKLIPSPARVTLGTESDDRMSAEEFWRIIKGDEE